MKVLIARRYVLNRVPRFVPRRGVELLLRAPVARPFLRRGYDRLAQSRARSEHARGTPTIH